MLSRSGHRIAKRAAIVVCVCGAIIGVSLWQSSSEQCIDNSMNGWPATRLSNHLTLCWQQRLWERDPRLLDEMLAYWRVAPQRQRRDLVEWSCQIQDLIERTNPRQRLAVLVWNTELIAVCEAPNAGDLTDLLERHAHTMTWTGKPLEYDLLVHGSRELAASRLLTMVNAYESTSSAVSRNVLAHALVNTTGIKAPEWSFDAATLAGVRRKIESIGTEWRISEQYQAAVSVDPVHWWELDNTTMLEWPSTP